MSLYFCLLCLSLFICIYFIFISSFIYIYFYIFFLCWFSYIYMGSSSVLVLTGSHSLCNSFVVNQFFFFTPNGENSLCYTPKKQWEQYGGKKEVLFIFLLAKYTLPCHAKMAAKNRNGDTLLLHTRRKYSDISNLFAKLQHAKAPES